MKRWVAVLILAAGMTPVAYGETAVIRITGYVPVICHADFVAAQVQANGIIQLGTVKEFCNAGSGYQLIANHSSGAGLGEIIIDGKAVPLDASGQTVLERMNGPRLITQSLAYRPGSSSITSISIEIRAAAI